MSVPGDGLRLDEEDAEGRWAFTESAELRQSAGGNIGLHPEVAGFAADLLQMAGRTFRAAQLPRVLEDEIIDGDLAAVQPWMAQIPSLLYRTHQLEMAQFFDSSHRIIRCVG